MVDHDVRTCAATESGGTDDRCAWSEIVGSGVPNIVAVRLGARRSLAAFTDAAGTLRPCDPSTEGLSLDCMLEEVLREAHQRKLLVRGLSFALPTGERWNEIAYSSARGFGLPVFTHSIAVAALEGEMTARPVSGVGGALLLDADEVQAAMHLMGERYTGVRGRAGAITHLGLDRTGTIACSCGRTGCLQALLQAGAEAPEPPCPMSCTPAPSRSLGWLAVAGIALVNVLNPALVFVQGAAFEATSALAWFDRAVREGCLPETGAGLLNIARVGPRSTLIGAASLLAARLP